MTERRALTEGLTASTQTVDPEVARAFVFQGKVPKTDQQEQRSTPSSAAATSTGDVLRATAPVSAASPATRGPTAPARAPVSTRLRADYAQLLKRVSLERQLTGREPHTLIDIFEESLGTWFAANGYIP